MNINLKSLVNSSDLPGLLKRRSVRIGLACLGVLLLVVVVYAAWFTDNDTDLAATAFVQRGPLTISVTEAGTVQSRERVVIKSEVEGTTTILSLVPEGVTVKKGDILVELDSSRLQDNKNQQQIVVLNAEASFIRARENLAVGKSQADSDVAQAELAYKFAKLDLEKYLKGEYLRDLQKAESEISIARGDLMRAEDILVSSIKLAGQGYITRTELQVDELSAKRAKIGLDLALSNLDLLKKYTNPRNLEQLRSDVEQAGKALERVKRKATADLVQTEAELKAKESENERQKAKLDKYSAQIGKCRITAPVAGMVVYATTGQLRWRRNVEPLEEGQQVRERQELIYLPTTSAMVADIKVQESSLRKVRTDMPVRITVDAKPGDVFWARVGKIALLPDAQSAFLNPDLKVYDTVVYIDGDASVLRAGMTCRAEIIVEQHSDTLYVPVQAVVRVGTDTVVYIRGRNGFEQRVVKVGLDNNRMIRIIEGVEEGDEVSLTPPLAHSAISTTWQVPDARPSGRSASTAPAKSVGLATPLTATQPASQPGFDPSRLRQMSREERSKLIQSLTPQQQEALSKQRQGSGTRRRPDSSEGREASAKRCGTRTRR
ncbi:MAG: biotin/lipoyl-binding protein, partial [Phycisphaerae bacterium]|nr:biotin/lipoyl-binding protein [Phycisphaerae bacterium]